MEKHFPRDIAALNSIFEFTNGFFVKNEISQSLLFTINFVIEELFTNMVKYNSKNGRQISVSLDVVRDQLVLRLTDFDVDPFDMTKSPPVDVSLPLEKRRIGGLGVHLIKKMVDKIEYEYVNRESRVMVTKALERNNV